MEGTLLVMQIVVKGKQMDPRFFRRYLDILDEQPLPAGVNQPATVNVGNNTSVTADPAAKIATVKTNAGGTDVYATRNLSTGNLSSVSAAGNVGGADIKTAQDFTTAKKGAGTVSVDAPVAPNTTAGATYTQAGYKGQMTPASQVRASSNIPNVGKIDAQVDQGAMFQGAGKNIQQGNPAIVTAKVTNPQGQTATYNTNRNL